jgi:hypothetical protein
MSLENPGHRPFLSPASGMLHENYNYQGKKNLAVRPKLQTSNLYVLELSQRGAQRGSVLPVM